MRTAAAAALLAIAAPAAASDAAWNGIADAGKFGLPAAAAGIALLKKDDKGLEQFAETFALTVVATEGLKYTVDSRRPDGGTRSFPSGHTSAAFAGAGYLFHRYGLAYGAPAFALATLTGVARVETRAHHWYDVVAGAAIGEGSAALFTRRLPKNVALVPWGDSRGGGFAMTASF